MSSKRRKFSPSEKLRIVLAGIADEGTIADLCRREGITSTQFYAWKRQLQDSADQVYKPKKDNSKEVDSLKETLQFKDSVIAEITEENLLLKKNPQRSGRFIFARRLVSDHRLVQQDYSADQLAA